MIDKKTSTAVQLLIKANRAHKKMIESSVCRNIGLHRTQHIILMKLFKKKTLPSQKELAQFLNVTPAAVTLALQKLESDGYISRSIGDDNRYNITTITPLGIKVVEESMDMFSKIDEVLFDGFSDEELSEFIGYLQRVNITLERVSNEEESTSDEKMV